ncbi:calmodulin, putative [Ricinus communis]|uniref:Calmodulin, putative n=2 Tax=Ricinus communis TaxID=3988 RepID=B9RDE4_RICCO|nr:calmodulin, putative [Ricinus communis]
MDNANKSKKNEGKRLSSTFELLTPSFAAMEVHNQFKQVFKLIDANGDGKISSCELSELLLCLGFDKSKATSEAEGMVREMDCNGDGFVDMDEFIYTLNDDGKLRGVGGDNKKDYLMDAFLIFDADKNGLISAEELKKVLTNLGCDNCSLKKCRRMIKGVDKDGDGSVNFEEFRSMMTNTSRLANTMK